VRREPPNQAIERSAEQRRCSVPSSLRSSAPAHCGVGQRPCIPFKRQFRGNSFPCVTEMPLHTSLG
jgi:hypothetical protein